MIDGLTTVQSTPQRWHFAMVNSASQRADRLDSKKLALP